MPRQLRDRRRAGMKVVLTARDQALLQAVGRFRLVRTADIGALFFPGRHRDVCADRLRRLFDAGFLEVHAAERSAPNLYGLGPAGRQWVVDHGGTVQPPPRGGRDHHLGIVAVWTMLASVLHGRPGLRLARFVPEWEIRSSHGRQAVVVPDAVVDIQRASGEAWTPVRLALEVDLGTEWLPVLRKKLRAYSEPHATQGIFGSGSFGLALTVLGRGVRREAPLRQVVAEEWKGEWVLWTSQEDIVAWAETRLGGLRAPVTDSRCGNGREGDASGDESRDQDVAGGMLSDNER